MDIGCQRTSKYEVIQFLAVCNFIMVTMLLAKDRVTICILILCNENCYFLPANIGLTSTSVAGQMLNQS